MVVFFNSNKIKMKHSFRALFCPSKRGKTNETRGPTKRRGERIESNTGKKAAKVGYSSIATIFVSPEKKIFQRLWFVFFVCVLRIVATLLSRLPVLKQQQQNQVVTQIVCICVERSCHLKKHEREEGDDHHLCLGCFTFINEELSKITLPLEGFHLEGSPPSIRSLDPRIFDDKFDLSILSPIRISKVS